MEAVVGQWVRHRGTLLWGEVVEVVPQRDGTLELLIRYERPPWYANPSGLSWWSSAHVNAVMDRAPASDLERQLGRPWVAQTA